eukprot:5855671-Pyramimonas_sp.AAC.1
MPLGLWGPSWGRVGPVGARKGREQETPSKNHGEINVLGLLRPSREPSGGSLGPSRGSLEPSAGQPKLSRGRL